MIQVKNVSMNFGNFTALDNVNLEIPSGCAFGFLGSNGAGKSTLMRQICGIYDVPQGEILIDGQKVFNNPFVKSEIFFVSDETVQFANFTLDELKKYYKNYYVKFDEQLFNKLVLSLSLPTNKKLAKFSKGMKRQSVVVIGLACNTKYLILDEAFDGLDPAMRSIVKGMIADAMQTRDLTLIVSSHNMAEITELCSRIMLIHKGKVLFSRNVDDPSESLAKIQAVFKDRQMQKNDFENLGMEILSFSQMGSVVCVIARGSGKEILPKIQQMTPDLCEEIPMTLDETFIYEMEVRGYGKNTLE